MLIGLHAAPAHAAGEVQPNAWADVAVLSGAPLGLLGCALGAGIGNEVLQSGTAMVALCVGGGAAAGFFGGRFVANVIDAETIPSAHMQLVESWTLWSIANATLLLSIGGDEAATAVGALSAISPLVGYFAGGATYGAFRPRAGAVAFANGVGLMTGVATLWLGGAARGHNRPTDLLRAIVMADLGLVVGILAAPAVRIDRGTVWLGELGIFVGAGIGALTGPALYSGAGGLAQRRASYRGALVGGAAGLVGAIVYARFRGHGLRLTGVPEANIQPFALAGGGGLALEVPW